MKIIYILPEYDANLDGHIYYLANFVQEISKDLEVFLIIEKSKEKNVNIKNISWYYVQKFSKNILFRSIELFFILLYRRFFWYKIVYIHYSYIWAIVSSIIMRCSFWKTYYWSCGMMWLFGKQTLLWITLKMITYLVTWVEALKLWYSKNYNIPENKILIMPNWIEINRASSVNSLDIFSVKESLGIPQDSYVVLFLHRLAKRKGAQYVAWIAKNLEIRKDIHFIVAWDWPYRQQLLNEIEDMRLENIHVIGKIPNKDIYKYFLASNVFLMPSEEEWFPRVLLESMACNIPYVASDIGWVREISPPELQKYIYTIWDIDWFSTWITQLLNEKFDFTNFVSKYDILNVVPIFSKLLLK